MKKIAKRTKVLLLILAVTILFSAVFLALTGYHRKYPEKMVSFEIVVYVEENNRNTYTGTCMNEWLLGDDYDAVMSSDAAVELIHELDYLPEVYGDETEPIAYEIHYRYYDEDNFQRWADKTGYGSFPGNWRHIINGINGMENKYTKSSVTYSTDIVSAEELLREAGVENRLPGNKTLDQFIQDNGMNSKKMFDWQQLLYTYWYDYYDFGSNRITKESTAAYSDADSLREYAEKHLDQIETSDDISITGTYGYYDFEIVRFDRFEEWKEKMEETYPYFEIEDCPYYNPDDKTLHINLIRCEVNIYLDIYVDSSNRFLIITECREPDIIYTFF